MTSDINGQHADVVQEMPPRERRVEPLGSTVSASLKLYFSNLNGYHAGHIYNMVMAEVERPMLEVVMEYVKGNQTQASQILGLSRSTLRKKLKIYNFDYRQN